MFAKRPELRLPNGKTKYNTLQGCMCSLMMLGVIVLFVLSSVRNMFLDSEFPDEDPRLDILMMNSVERDYYNGQTWFNVDEDGADFQIAFGITELGYADEAFPADIGTLKAYYRYWDWTKPIDENPLEYREIDTRPCTVEELGLEPPATEDSESRRLDDEEEETAA